ncbi:MAG TPA: hypothetical protein VHM70_21845 [Polyangiaceae bacterium]|nr:hypothetical protein [Polyangiaceae bacterium]
MSLIAVTAILAIGLLTSYRNCSAAFEEQKLDDVRRLTAQAGEQMTRKVERLQLTARFLANYLSGEAPPAGFDLSSLPACQNPPAPTDTAWAEHCLEALLRDNPDIYGASITYRPNPLPRSVYIYKNGAGQLLHDTIADSYPTSDEDGYLWYREPMQTGRDGWSPPYYDDAGKVLMTTFSAVFRLPTRETGAREVNTDGVVTVDVSSDRLREMVQELDLGPGGYGALTGRNGTYLYHPSPEYLQGRKTLEEVAKEKNDPDRLKMWEAIQRGESGIISHTSVTTGEDTWLLFVQVGNSGWSLQNTFVKNDIDFDQDTLRRRLIGTTSAALVLLLSLWVYATSRRTFFSIGREWLLSTGSTLLLIAAIGTTWALALRFPADSRASAEPVFTNTHKASVGCEQLPPLLGENNNTHRRVTELGVLSQVEHDYGARASCQKSLTPVFVKLGTNIEVLKFDGPTDVKVAGLVWTRVPADAPPEVKGAVALSAATDLKLELAESRVLPDGERLTRWHFQATLTQNRSSTRYPIEREAVHIGFQHPDPVVFDTPDGKDPALAGTAPDTNPSEGSGRGYRVYLVPSLGDYDLTTPSAKPGLYPNLAIAGWRAKQSYFEFLAPPRGSEFGLATSSSELIPPVLTLAVVLERDFADVFISNLTPIIVVAIMLFAVLLVSARLDYGRALSICMGMFFVIVFSHIGLRQRLAVQQIFYLEYFYFTIYAGILWVSFNCLLQGFQTKIKLIEDRDRLLVKTVYWPVLLGTLYVCTLTSFY